MAPNAARIAALARFVPTLDEVMVHVRRRRAGEFRLGVVGLPGSGVAGFDHRSRVQVDAANECQLRRKAGIDDPTRPSIGCEAHVTVRVELGGCHSIKKKTTTKKTE